MKSSHPSSRLVGGVVVAAAFFALSATCEAEGIQTPEPLSGGKFMRSKGTKASEAYEAAGERAGGFDYEYGKGIQAGPVNFRPIVQYDLSWENNVFRDDNDRKSDYIHHLGAGSTAELPLAGGQHLLAGTYIADVEWFDRFGDQDHTDHNVQAGGQFNFVPFSLSIEDTFKRTVDRADTEFTGRVGRNENALHALLEIPFAAFFLETEFIDYNLDFRLPEDSIFDRHDIAFYQRVGVDIGPSTQLLGEYGYTDINYDNFEDRDGTANQGSMGLRGHLTELITYQAWFGYQSRVYDDDSRPDFNDFVARGALQYDISEESRVVLRADRRPEESTFDNQSFYARNRLEVEWRQQILERLFFNTKEIFQYNEYSRTTLRSGDDETRRDYVWRTGVGLEYVFPNDLISILVDYTFNARDSNTSGLDYDAQTVRAGVKSLF